MGEGVGGVTIKSRVALSEAMLGLTVKDRLEWVAIEMDSLSLLATYDPWNNDILGDIEAGEYKRAIAKARGDYEPPDPPGFEGGFADNH